MNVDPKVFLVKLKIEISNIKEIKKYQNLRGNGNKIIAHKQKNEGKFIINSKIKNNVLSYFLMLSWIVCQLHSQKISVTFKYRVSWFYYFFVLNSCSIRALFYFISIFILRSFHKLRQAKGEGAELIFFQTIYF